MRSTIVDKSIIKNPMAYVYPRVEIDGQDLTDRLSGVMLSADTETKGWSCELTFASHPSLPSLAPWSGGAYNNTLKPNKIVKVYLKATLTKGDTTGGYDLIFEGRVGDDVNVSQDISKNNIISVRLRSKWIKLLQDNFVLDERAYPIACRGANPWEIDDENASASAVVVAQQILNEHMASPPTLRVQHDPNYAIYPYIVAEEDLWTLLQNLFLATGFDLRERYWPSTESFEIVLSDPLAVGGADTLGAGHYARVSVNYTDTDVRNIVRVYYRSRDPDADIAAGAKEPPMAPYGILYVERRDAASISAFGERPMKIVEDEVSLIDTYQEAYNFAGYVLNDLKSVQAKVQIETPSVLYYVEPYDVITLSGPGDGEITVTRIELSVRREGGRVLQGTRIEGVRAYG